MPVRDRKFVRPMPQAAVRRQERQRNRIVDCRLNAVRRKMASQRIALLVHHFVQKYRARLGKHVEGVSPGALARLAAYEFPGNVEYTLAPGASICTALLLPTPLLK